MLCIIQACDYAQQIDIPDSVFDSAPVIKASDTLDFLSDGSERDIYVLGDSLLFCREKASAVNRIYTIYNISDKAERKYLKYGPRDGELLSNLTFLHSDTLVTLDVVKKCVYISDLKKAVSDTGYVPYGGKIVRPPQYLLPFKGRLLCLNPECFPEGEKPFQKNGRRFYMTDSSFNYPVVKSRYYTMNVVTGLFDINWARNRIIFADGDINKIEVYDTDLNLLKVMRGRNRYVPRYAYFKIDSVYNFAWDEVVPQAYMCSASTEDYFYCCYLDTVLMEDSERNEFCSYILRLDWDGNILDSYKVECYVRTISVSSENGRTLYVYGLGKGGWCVTRYNLK